MSTTLHDSQSRPEIVPPLENGDRLTRAEFYRRWEAMPEVKKAERIEGVVIMPAAVRWEQHGDPDGCLNWWLKHYQVHTPGTECGTNSTLRLDFDNDPQPDSFLRIAPECGGQSGTSEGYVISAPELIAEVAASSTSSDLNQKLDVYRRNGVQEYVVWKVLEEDVVWFVREEDRFVETAPDVGGIFRSRTFPGLRLDSRAMLENELTTVLETLQTGLDSPEHTAFVQQLESIRTGG